MGLLKFICGFIKDQLGFEVNALNRFHRHLAVVACFRVNEMRAKCIDVGHVHGRRDGDGSYWIYKDSIDNTLDSIYVYKIISTFKTHLAHDTNRVYEEIRMWFGGYSADMECILSNNTISRSVGVNNVMQIFNLDTTLTVNLPRYGTNKNYSISNFSVLNTNYGNVRCFGFKYLFFNPHQTDFDFYETNYWKKNIGVVKSLYGQPNSSIRKLLRYHVTQ